MALIGFLFFLIFMLVLGIWILPFVVLTAICVGAIAISSSIFFRIFGYPEFPQPPTR
jgi:hypothetical protein